MSRVLDELVDVTGLRKNEGEEEQSYLLRLVVATDAILEKDTKEGLWNSLLGITKKWLNSAILAIGENKIIPRVPGTTKEFFTQPEGAHKQILLNVETKDKEGMVAGILAKDCKKGSRYKIDLDGTVILAECIRINEDKVIFEAADSDRYALFTTSTVIPVDEKKIEKEIPFSCEDIPSYDKCPPIIAAPKTFITTTKKRTASSCLRFKICEDPTLGVDAMLAILEESGYSNVNRDTVRSELAYSKTIIQFLKDLGKYVDKPINLNS